MTSRGAIGVGSGPAVSIFLALLLVVLLGGCIHEIYSDGDCFDGAGSDCQRRSPEWCIREPEPPAGRGLVCKYDGIPLPTMPETD